MGLPATITWTEIGAGFSAAGSAISGVFNSAMPTSFSFTGGYISTQMAVGQALGEGLGMLVLHGLAAVGLFKAVPWVGRKIAAGARAVHASARTGHD